MIILVYHTHDLEVGNIVNFECNFRIHKLRFIRRRTVSIEIGNFYFVDSGSVLKLGTDRAHLEESIACLVVSVGARKRADRRRKS